MIEGSVFFFWRSLLHLQEKTTVHMLFVWEDQTGTYNKIQKGGHCNDPCTLTIINLLCNPLAHAFSNPAPCSLLTKLSSKSPCFIKCRPGCQNLYVAEASQSQRICEAISEACTHASITWNCLPAQSKSMSF